MKLPVFELVEGTVELLRQNKAQLEMMASQLEEIFAVVFEDGSESLVTITSRVKSEDSLREKILRKSLYKRHAYPQGIYQNLSDLIGLRVECRFLEDERRLFQRLQDQFTAQAEDGYSYCPGNHEVRLDLREPQPQSQNNGFSIYRIDGLYGELDDCVRFELQIKAMVHVFWTEVEHEIIYKNNSYMLMDSFMKELLSLAYANLSLVDNQIYMIYRQTKSQSEPVQNYVQAGAIRALFAKAISDTFYHKMRQSLGFTVNFRHSCDILSRYLLEKQGRERGMEPVSVQALMDRVNKVMSLEIDFEEPLLLEKPFRTRDPFENILAEHLLSQMNSDYEWNIFFRMLFVLEPGNNAEDFAELLRVVRARLSDAELYAPIFEAWPEREAEGFRQYTLIVAAHQLAADGDVRIIYENALEQVRENIRREIRELAKGEPPKGRVPLRLWAPEE